MYVPPEFAEKDIPVLHEAIRHAGLATLVTVGASGIEANHVPMLIDAEPAPFGTLLGHVSRGNPQWRRSDPAVESLAIFRGPDAYVSPSWYQTKKDSGKVVPTWNYVAIHAYGRVEFFDDPVRLRAIVTRLTERHEGGRAAPWAVTDAPEDFIAAQLQKIVGFVMPIARLEGKWKMSQNRVAQDSAGAAAGLAREGNTAVAAIITSRNRG
jgi:transcriptional regulator